MINVQNKNFYNIDTISGIMSLRKPQKKSLEILSEILKNVQLSKETNLDNALRQVFYNGENARDTYIYWMSSVNEELER